MSLPEGDRLGVPGGAAGADSLLHGEERHGLSWPVAADGDLPPVGTASAEHGAPLKAPRTAQTAAGSLCLLRGHGSTGLLGAYRNGSKTRKGGIGTCEGWGV